MRDPERIDRIGAKLLDLWRRQPDYRLGQLVENIEPLWLDDNFYVEDDEWEAWIEAALTRLDEIPS